MDYVIEYYSEAVQEAILSLPDTLAARYVSQKTPPRELKVARKRMKEVKHADS